MSENKKTFATPNVRKFARELGANINEIKGTERKGRIAQDDVKKFINNQLYEKKKIKSNPKIEFNHSDFGEIQIKEIPRIKRISSSTPSKFLANIPHVTHHDEADITEIEEFRSSLTDMNTGEKKKIHL